MLGQNICMCEAKDMTYWKLDTFDSFGSIDFQLETTYSIAEKNKFSNKNV